MAKLQPCLTQAESLVRFDAMLLRVLRDLRHAVMVEGALEGANDTVRAIREAGGDLSFRSADTFEVIQNALALNLALAISRLFDPGARRRFPRDSRDVASLPALMWLIRPGGCRTLLAERATQWMGYQDVPTTVAALDDVRRSVAEFQRSAAGSKALTALLEFRNKLLAHNLMLDIEGAMPIYSDLFDLSRFARTLGSQLKLFAEGRNWDADERRRIQHRSASEFWSVALPALAQSDA